MNAGARAKLLRQTRRVWSEPSEQPAAIGAGGSALEPGSVVVLERTASFDVEWVILAEDSSAPNRYFVVAADGLPLVGGTDLVLPTSAGDGSLVLRGRIGGWVAANLLYAAKRTDTLSLDAIIRALDLFPRTATGEVQPLRRAAEIAAIGSILTREVDDDLEYGDWFEETLKPAWQALAGQPLTVESGLEPAGNEATAPSGATESRGSRDWLSKGWRLSRDWRRHRLALAATVLLALTATLFWRQHQELLEQRGIAELRHREWDQLRKEREQWNDERHQLGTEKGQLETALNQLRAERTRLEAEKDQLRAQAAVRNPLVDSLEPNPTRRGRRPAGRGQHQKEFRLDADVSHLILAVTLNETEPRQRYRAELVDRATDKILWTQDDLRDQSLSLWLVLPRTVLPASEYRLRIHVTKGAPGATTEYNFRILEDKISKNRISQRQADKSIKGGR